MSLFSDALALESQSDLSASSLSSVIVAGDFLLDPLTGLLARSFSVAPAGGNPSQSDLENLDGIESALPAVAEILGPFSVSSDLAVPEITTLDTISAPPLLDLTEFSGRLNAEFVVSRDAAFDSFVGFYKVVNSDGGIDTNCDGVADVNPGDPLYTSTAIEHIKVGLTVADQQTTTVVDQLRGDVIYAPLIIVNGRPEAYVSTEVYFPFIAANADGATHINVLGNNTFGFEDLPFGGDQDFNDMVVAVTVTPLCHGG